MSFTSCLAAVVFHDDEVDRITQATGRITSFTHTNLRKLNLATKHPLGASYNFVAIPNLEDFVKECLSLKMKMIIDLKTYDTADETTTVIVDLYKKYPSMKSCTLVTSFFPQILYKLRRQNPDILCSISHRPHFLAYSTYDGTNEGMKPR